MKVFYHQVGWTVFGEKGYRNRKEVEKDAGAVVKIVKVEGGWLTFEFWDEYETWRKQK